MSDQTASIDESAQNLTRAEMTAEIVSAYITKNSVPAAELPGLIQSVYATLGGLGKPAPETTIATKKEPAVPVKKSITDEFIISLEDGRKFKSMKRYLSGLGMTPADYRAKWGLPHDYPMVAPAYAAKRSALAKTSGLGSMGRNKADIVLPVPDPKAEATAPKRTRAKKAA